MAFHSDMNVKPEINSQPLAAYEKVRVLHEKVARSLKKKFDSSDFRDCEDSASEALVVTVGKFGGIEPLVTGKNPETGKDIFNFVFVVAKRALWKMTRKERKLATALKTETAEVNEFDFASGSIDGRSHREFVIRCIGKLPPFEQKLAGVVAQFPDASERDLARMMSELAGRDVTRYSISKGMAKIRNVFLSADK